MALFSIEKRSFYLDHPVMQMLLFCTVWGVIHGDLIKIREVFIESGDENVWGP